METKKLYNSGEQFSAELIANKIFVENTPNSYGKGDFTENGYYSNTTTTLNVGYNYKSIPIIIVNEGDTVVIKNVGSVASSLAVIYCYDNDGNPYNGNNARKNFSDLECTDATSGTYKFVIPTNCSQLGISIVNPSTKSDSFEISVGNDNITLTEKGRSVFSGIVSSTSSDDVSGYYLKGNSNVSFGTKKLGIISAGQSNIDNRNPYSELPSTFVNPNGKVHITNKGGSSSSFSSLRISESSTGLDWSFDSILYDLLTSTSYGNKDEIYVVKHSMGGTSIDKEGATDYHWTADYEQLSSESNSLLRVFESKIRGAMERDGDKFDIQAIVWHQGEGDGTAEAVAGRYYINLKKMIAYIRGIVGNPRLHFFTGNIPAASSVTYKSIVNSAIAKIASEDAYFHYVDLSNAQLKDSWHFNSAWSNYFGQKVYDLMVDEGIISGTKINPSEPY